jgi:hypothetical protein
MSLLLVVIVLFLLFGGGFGTYHAFNTWGQGPGIGLGGLLLLIILLVVVFGRG